MRDDLHHSLPQTHPWRKVIRVACAPGLDGDLIDAVTRAVWSTWATWWNERWGQHLRHVLDVQQEDFFGNERIERELSSLESSCPSHDARRALDIAISLVSTGQPTGDLKNRVVCAALRVSAEDGIEGAVAWVAKEHPEKQVRELRTVLHAALLECDFRQPPAPKQRKPKATLEQSLAIDLPLKG